MPHPLFPETLSTDDMLVVMRCLSWRSGCSSLNRQPETVLITRKRRRASVGLQGPAVGKGWSLRLPLPFFSIYFIYLFIYFSFIFISCRLITLQYCSGFCHTLTWISHGFTCVPHPDPPTHLPLHPIPLGLPSAPGPSTCLMHPAWAGDLFHHR